MNEAKKPTTALFLGLCVPGAGHLYAGRPRAALLAFLAVSLPFALGCWIVGVRLFGFTSPLFPKGSLASLLPVHLVPEIGNLGETVLAWALRGEPSEAPAAYDYARLLRLPVPGEHLGLALTGLAGYLNAILAADAQWLVAAEGLAPGLLRRRDLRPALICLWGWLLPGAAHWRLGARRAAVAVGVGVLGLFALGLFFSAGRGIDRPQLYWWWAAQAGAGLPAFAGSIFLGPLEVVRDLPYKDLGVTLLSIAGLLNVVTLTDAYTRAEALALGRSEAGDGGRAASKDLRRTRADEPARK